MSGGFNLKSVVTVATYPKLEQGKLTNSGVVMLGWQLEPNNKPKKTKKSYGSKKTQGSKKSYKVDKKVQLNGSFSVGAQAKTNDKVGTDVNPIKMSPIVELKTGCSIPLGETDWTVNPQ